MEGSSRRARHAASGGDWPDRGDGRGRGGGVGGDRRDFLRPQRAVDTRGERGGVARVSDLGAGARSPVAQIFRMVSLAGFRPEQWRGQAAELGTRHRAAIGLTEETDAVVVAVSEETGAISYAHKGQLTRGASVEELRAFLTSVLVRAPRSHKFSEWFRSPGFARSNGGVKPPSSARGIGRRLA